MHIMSKEYNSRYSNYYDCQNHHQLNSLKFEKPIYESAPIARNTVENNQVQIISYRGIKLTSFNVDGRQLICLPQAFDYFLKNLVGGLHTVYTKLKRLEIIPIVCNVEQVRILRGLGAIQPGVNRCKLLAPSEFDILYDDCTNSGSRPGRPPKRNTSQQIDECSEDKHQTLSTNYPAQSFSEFKYPFHMNNYLSISSTINESNLSPFNTSAFTSTLSNLYSPNNKLTTTNDRFVTSNESRSFTIDAMLNNNRNRLTKPIDQSTIAIEQTSSSILSAHPTTEPINFFYIKNMIETVLENARLREKELENEINDIKSEISKEQDCRHKLEQDFVQLRRVRNALIKKLKRLHRSNDVTKGNNDNLLDRSSSSSVDIESI